MKVKQVVESKLDNVEIDGVNFFFSPKDEDIISVEDSSDSDAEKVGKLTKSNPELVGAIADSFSWLRDVMRDMVIYTKDDMLTLWNRMDELEERVKKLEGRIFEP